MFLNICHGIRHAGGHCGRAAVRRLRGGRHCRLALLLATTLGSVVATAQDDERPWSFGLALGYGERSNPLINGETIDINAVVDFSWYGERLFFDNGDFGFMLHEQRAWSVNLVATFNNERNYYNYLTGRTFGLDSLADSRLGIKSVTDGGAGMQGEAKDNIPYPENLLVGSTGYVPAELNLNTELMSPSSKA